MKRAKGHIIRWAIIVVMGIIVLGALTSFSLTPERGIKESLLGMNLPVEVEAVSVIDAGGIHAIVFWDEKYQMYHHSFMKRVLGLFWEARGGGFGTGPQEEWQIKFGEGYSTQGSRAYHYVIGWINDPEVAIVEVLWRDRTLEQMEPAMGKIIHFAKEGKAGSSAGMVEELYAYDRQDKLLYTLDNVNYFAAAD